MAGLAFTSCNGQAIAVVEVTLVGTTTQGAVAVNVPGKFGTKIQAG